jgi:catechol 2,3-dioxygenase-like lactoylglutathione lyase family enzyme
MPSLDLAVHHTCLSVADLDAQQTWYQQALGLTEVVEQYRLVSVRDLDQAFASITAAGGTAVWPPAPAVQPGARFAYVKDPEGNLIELIQLPGDDA